MQQIEKNGIRLNIGILKYHKEHMIRREMERIEKLITHINSNEFYKEFGIGRFWQHDSIYQLTEKCKEHLRWCAEELKNSKNYQ